MYSKSVSFRQSISLAIMFVFLLACSTGAIRSYAASAPAQEWQDETPYPEPFSEESLPPDLRQAVYEALAPEGGGGPKHTFFPTAANEYFGFSAALSFDGAYAVIGAYGAVVNGKEDAGAVYVFHDNGFGWDLQSRLVLESTEAGQRFGIAVDIDRQGNAIIVGADRRDDYGLVDAGAAYIFARDGDSWNYITELTHDAGADARFGWAVSIGESGNFAYVGAYNANIGASGHDGKVYTYRCSGIDMFCYAETWISAGTLTFGNDGDYFGYSLSKTNNGLLAVGSPGYNNVGANSGRVSLFQYNNPGWSTVTHLYPNDAAAGDYFGRSVSINVLNTRLVVGASLDDIGSNSDQGSAYIFNKIGASWTQTNKLYDSNGTAGDHFGVSVRLDGGGDHLLVGALDASQAPLHPTDEQTSALANKGTVWKYHLVGSTWQAERLDYCAGAGDRCGVAVALADNATRYVVGADRADIDATINQGAAYIVTAVPPSNSTVVRLSGAGMNNLAFGRVLALSQDGQTAIIGSYMMAFIFARSGAGWQLQAYLPDPNGNSGFGRSVAISGDGRLALVGAPSSLENGHASVGAAYVYIRSGSAWTLQAKLLPADPVAGDEFGKSVALSKDGLVAAIGTPEKDSGTLTDQGAVYVFKRSGVTWSQRSKLELGGPEAHFGSAVALNHSGSVLLASAPDSNVSGKTDRGMVAAFIYASSTNTWIYQAMLPMPDGMANDHFGAAVDVSPDGLTALVGAPGKDVSGITDLGQAYALTFNPATATWSHFATLAFPYPETADANTMYGEAVSLSGDGQLALIGAPKKRYDGLSFRGGMLPFLRTSTTYQPKSWYITDYTSAPYFGSGLAQDSYGRIALVGARNAALDGDNQYRTGTAFEYELYLRKFLYCPLTFK